MRHIATLTLVLPLLFAGCSSVSINYDYNRDADFSAYKTFDWLPGNTKGTGDQLVDRRVHAAVVNELTAKGFRQSPNPDLHVVWHVVLRDRVQLYNWGGGWGGGYRGYGWGWGGSQVDVVNYTEGTLVIDMVDAKTKELVWRGSARGTVDPDPSPQQLDENVKKTVAKILANFPPPSSGK